MLRDDAAAAVERRLGFLSGKRDVVIEELKLAQARLEAGILSPFGGVFWPWFLFTHSRASLPAGTEAVVLPDDYLADAEGESVWLTDASGNRWSLQRRSLDEFSGVAGMPRYYEVTGEDLRFDPVPSSDLTIDLYYYGADAALDTNIENKWLRYAPGLLIASATRELAISLHISNVAQAAQVLLDEERRRLWAAHSAHVELHERDYRIGDRE